MPENVTNSPHVARLGPGTPIPAGVEHEVRGLNAADAAAAREAEHRADIAARAKFAKEQAAEEMRLNSPASESTQ